MRGGVPPISGQQFGGQIIPSATVLVVGVGRTEAKVEGLFSEVCRLEYKGSVFASMGGEVLKGARERQLFATAELEQRSVQPELWRSPFSCFAVANIRSRMLMLYAAFNF